jgi:hypothetical protein
VWAHKERLRGQIGRPALLRVRHMLEKLAQGHSIKAVNHLGRICEAEYSDERPRSSTEQRGSRHGESWKQNFIRSGPPNLI